jgi:hypothetical protein
VIWFSWLPIMLASAPLYTFYIRLQRASKRNKGKEKSVYNNPIKSAVTRLIYSAIHQTRREQWPLAQVPWWKYIKYAA